MASKYTKAPVINENCLVLTDLHHPYQDDAFLNDVLDLAYDLKVKAVYLGGDTWDFNFASAYADNPPEGLREEREAWLRTKEKLDAQFTRKVVGMGNHEDRIARNKKLDTVQFVELLVGDSSYEVSPYYYAKIHGVWVGHPTTAAVEAHTKLSIAEDMPISIGHTHHFAMRQSPNGKYLAVQQGCMVDTEKLKYGNINNAGSQKQVQGASIIMKVKNQTVIMPINKFFPVSFWRSIRGE